MKKLLSTALLALFLLNVGGYYLVIWGLQSNHESNLIQRLDKNLYHADETLTIKIPLTLPYPIHTRDFERVDGTFEYEGQFYRLVKQKLVSDTLHIVCYKDDHSQQLESVMEDFAKTTADVPSSPRKQTSNVKPISEYEATPLQILLSTEGWCLKRLYCEHSPGIPAGYFATFSPPPKNLLS